MILGYNDILIAENIHFVIIGGTNLVGEDQKILCRQTKTLIRLDRVDRLGLRLPRRSVRR